MKMPLGVSLGMSASCIICLRLALIAFLCLAPRARAAEITTPLRQFGYGSLFCAAFSPDGSKLVTGSYDKKARIFDGATGKLLREFSGHTDTVYTAAFSPDGSKILTGGWDATARLWNAATGELLHTITVYNSTTIVTSVAFSADGARILTGTNHGIVRVWDAASGQLIGFSLSGPGQVTTVAFSPDGSRILAGSNTKNPRWLWLWDAGTGAKLKEYSIPDLQDASFSPDGSQVRFWYGNTVQTLDASTGALVHTFEDTTTTALKCSCLSRDGSRFLVFHADQTANLWSVPAGRLLASWTCPEEVRITALSSDGSTALTGNDKACPVRIWNAAIGQLCVTISDFLGDIQSLAYSPDSHKVALGCYLSSNSLTLWDTYDGRKLVTITDPELIRELDYARRAVLSPDGKKIWSQINYKYQLWSFDFKELIWEMEYDDFVHYNNTYHVCFSPDGARILTGHHGFGPSVPAAKVRNASTGVVERNLTGQTREIHSVAYSPDGKMIMTASQDGTVWLWNAATYEVLHKFRVSSDECRAAAFSPDGRTILTGNWRGEAFLWLIPGYNASRTWQDYDRE